MKIKNISYIVLMFIFIIISYILFDRGINAKTKLYIHCQKNSNITYKVYLNDNNIYNKKYLDMNNTYISNTIDHIDINFDYKALYSQSINGYYSYSVVANLNAYQDNIKDIIWNKTYTLLENKVKVLNQNDIKNINIVDNIIVDYNLYQEELTKLKKNYNLDIMGYLDIKLIINNDLNSKEISNPITSTDNIELTIPINNETTKINLKNINKKTNYYDFTRKQPINYILLVIFAFTLSLAISFFALIIKSIVDIYQTEYTYNKELKRILNKYDDIIISINKFYNKKEYNLIYVDNFKELLDVYNKIKNPINFKEIKKNSKAIFVIIDDENAWIYEMKKNSHK